MGTPALTSRGLKEADFDRVADLIDRAIKIGVATQEKTGKKLVDFQAALVGNADIDALRKEVEEFASGYSFPGFNVEEMKYKQ